MEKIRVAINGYGTIGRRVAYAIQKQPDMELSGVAKMSPDYRAAEMAAKGVPVYAAGDKTLFAKARMPVAGTARDMLAGCDVVVDCSPKDVGAKNAALYKRYGHLKIIYQGGEESGVAPLSFSAQCNYDKAWQKKEVRVVSCNTTALCRTLHTLERMAPIRKARVAIARRAADPDSTSKGLINAWVPIADFPSHHAHDVREVLPHMNIVSLAGLAPMSLMHAHMLFVEFRKDVFAGDVLRVLAENPRIWVLPAMQRVESTAHIKEVSATRPFGDVYETCVWENTIGVAGNELGMQLAVDQRAIVVPETIDAVRALMGTMNAAQSMELTNETLRMKGELMVLPKRTVTI